jgi:hypothetical protein
MLNASSSELAMVDKLWKSKKVWLNVMRWMNEMDAYVIASFMVNFYAVAFFVDYEWSYNANAKLRKYCLGQGFEYMHSCRLYAY